MPQNDASRDTETAPLSLDPTCGELRVEYTVPDDLLAQCAQYGHVEKMEFGTLSELTVVHQFHYRQLT